MRFSHSVWIVFVAVVETHVYFPFSEVIQGYDLNSQGATNPVESFQCADGCRIYTDLFTAKVGVFLDGKSVVSFNEFAGNSKGYDLKAGSKYQIKSTTRSVDDFVFYVVSVKAPNFDSYALAGSQSTFALPFVANANTVPHRYLTVLTSYNSLDVNKFTGTYPAGFPRIYATGPDALSDVYGNGRSCTPVYQARSQQNAEQSQIRVSAPIMTIDFGFMGTHGVTVNRTNGDIYYSPTSSTVYMSPGYVGCNFEGSQVYYSPMKSASAAYQLFSNSLDISAVYNDVQSSERVNLKVNQDDLGFFNLNSSSLSRSYRDQGVFEVELKWTRKTTASSWVLQLDFGEINSGSSLSASVVSIVVFLFAGSK